MTQKIFFFYLYLCICMIQIACETPPKQAKNHTKDSLKNQPKPKKLKSIGKSNLLEEIVIEKVKLDTIIKYKNKTISFEEVSKDYFDKNFQYNNIIEEKYKIFCEPPTDYEQFFKNCVLKIEEKQLLEDSAFVKKKFSKSKIGPHQVGTLFFKLNNSTQKKLADNDTFDTDVKIYHYRQKVQLKNGSFYLVLSRNWEGSNYVLIDAQTGIETIVNGIPRISLDSTHILTTSYNIGSYFNDPALQVWTYENNKLKLVYKDFFLGKKYAIAWRASWLDNETILGEIGHSFSNSLEGKQYFKLKLKI